MRLCCRVPGIVLCDRCQWGSLGIVTDGRRLLAVEPDCQRCVSAGAGENVAVVCNIQASVREAVRGSSVARAPADGGVGTSALLLSRACGHETPEWRTGVGEYLLTRFEDPIELVAHEIEHVIEQLEGIDLGALAGTGNVWKRKDGAFETRRAIEVGKRVAREVNAAEDPTANDGQVDSVSLRVHAIALHDRFPLLTGPPSGRVSPSGRQVVFTSYASLVAGDGNRTRDIYVMDVSTRRVTLETLGAGDHSANGESINPDISRDGRFVVFESTAGNLTNVEFARGIPRVFLRDRQTDIIIRLLSTNARDEPANRPSMHPAISADGEAVVFISSASDNLEDTVGGTGVYLIRLAPNTRTRVDVTSQGQVRSGQSASPAISADDRYVAFMSRADLTPRDGSSPADDAPDGNGASDIYVTLSGSAPGV